MSRLTSHQQKQFRNKMMMYSILLVGLVVFFYLIGFQLIINAGLLFGQLTNKKVTTTQEKKEDFYGTFSIDDIPTATNSARIMVSGYVTNYDELTFYVNNKEVKSKEFSTSDSFSEEIGDLKPGDNEVYLKATSKTSKETKESKHFTISYRNEKPKLEITEPNSSTKVKRPEIKVTGTTGKETFIKVNNLPIVVTSDGAFQTNIQLQPGDNTITVTAEDNAGNMETKTVTVTYEKES